MIDYKNLNYEVLTLCEVAEIVQDDHNIDLGIDVVSMSSMDRCTARETLVAAIIDLASKAVKAS